LFYIRIGKIPIDGISRIYRGEVLIGEEKGVSCYYGVQLKGKWHIIIPNPLKIGAIQTLESLINQVTEEWYKVNPKDKSKIYLIDGEEIGIGSDGEPILKNVKIIKEITKELI